MQPELERQTTYGGLTSSSNFPLLNQSAMKMIQASAAPLSFSSSFINKHIFTWTFSFCNIHLINGDITRV